MPKEARLESAMVAATASMVATKSPYAAGEAKADGSEEETAQALGAVSNEPKCVWHHQRNKRVVSLQSPKPRPEVEVRVQTKDHKTHEDAESK